MERRTRDENLPKNSRETAKFQLLGWSDEGQHAILIFAQDEEEADRKIAAWGDRGVSLTKALNVWQVR